MKHITIILALIFMGGCVITKTQMLTKGTYYEPTEFAEVLFQQPTKPYKQIAFIESEGSIGHDSTDLVKSMQKKAQKLGGDAVIILGFNKKWQSGNAYVQSYQRQQAKGVVIKWQ